MIEAIADSRKGQTKKGMEASALMMQTGNNIESDGIGLDDDTYASDNKQKKSKVASKAASKVKAKVAVDPDAKVNRKELDATRLYLREIEGSPLLTAEEEVFYSRKALKRSEERRVGKEC